jgi:hypothetical protein
MKCSQAVERLTAETSTAVGVLALSAVATAFSKQMKFERPNRLASIHLNQALLLKVFRWFSERCYDASGCVPSSFVSSRHFT